MYKDPNFKTIISIEKTRIENFMAYVYIKFLTPRPSEENKCYRLWIEDASGLYDLASIDYYWIDRYGYDQPDLNQDINAVAQHISINRNRTICIPIKLYMNEVSNNRFIKRCKLHLKEQNITAEKEHSLWISDPLVLASKEITVPEIHCNKIKILSDGSLQCNIKLESTTGKDETNFNNYLIPYVAFYSKDRLIAQEKCSVFDNNGTFIFKSTGKYAYDETKQVALNNKIHKITVEIRFLNGELAGKKDFVLDSMQKFTAFYGEELNISKCYNIGIALRQGTTGVFKVKKIIDIYQKP